MFRKMLLAVVASLSLLSPLALPADTQAHEPVPMPHHHRVALYVRECCHEPWRCVGRYECREDAFRAARHYRHRGFETLVR